MRRTTPQFILLRFLLCALCGSVVSSSVHAAGPEYNRDVRPILAENCFACHGPDSAARKAKLRLDQRDEAVKKAIVPGKPDESEALRRIKATAPETCVIMVTAVEDIDSARSALAIGASDYVTKPFSFQYLDSVLEVHMLMDHIDTKPR